MTRLWLSAAAAAAGLMASAPAYSRAVVIDGNTLTSFTACAYNSSPCQGFSTISAAGSLNAVPAAGSAAINFTLNYGNGPQSNVYVYNNGLISIGSQLTGNVTTINSLAALGQNALTPMYDPALQVLQNSFQYSSGIVNGGPFFGQQFLRINYAVDFNGVQTLVQANFYQNGNPGDWALMFAYGNFTGTPTFPDSGLIGYSLGGNFFQTTAGASAADIADSDNENVFRYAFVNSPGTAGVPEPATWLQMMLGFGMLGYSARRSGFKRRIALANA